MRIMDARISEMLSRSAAPRAIQPIDQVPDVVLPVSIAPEWSGMTCFIIGGGPSLERFNAEDLPGLPIIAINRAYEMCPWCDILYFGDKQWYGWHADKLTPFRGRMVTVSQLPGVPGIRRLRLHASVGLSPHRDHLTGNNSGHQAISLAVLLGVTRIVLLGFDMDTKGDKTHWHDGHPDQVETARRREILVERMLPKFSTLVEPLKAAGVEVINASPSSNLLYWPRMTIQEALEAVR